jgi:hypothetical protein
MEFYYFLLHHKKFKTVLAEIQLLKTKQRIFFNSNKLKFIFLKCNF